MYSKRSDTSGIRGQLYETKLLSLLYFRAFHDDTIHDFQIASNIDKIGAFDDICFRATVEGFDNPVAVFIQAKHKENEKQTLQSDLSVYFDSYLKIRQKFDQSNNDSFFKGKFDETECLFVIYTTAKDDFDNNTHDSGLFSILHDLIDTEGTAKKPYGQEEDVELLCEIVIKEQVTTLAERIAKYIYDDKNFQMLLSDDLFNCYHVILTQKVLDVSEIQSQQGTTGLKHRIASFRNDFFDNQEDYIVLFKDRLYKEVIKRRKIEPPYVRYFLSDFLGNPTDVKLSKLIGTVITYNSQTGQLHFDQKATKTFRPKMRPIDVSLSTVNKAIELAAREILSDRKFKVPPAFGNKDLTISDRRINHIAPKIVNMLKNCGSSKIVTIDESMEDGLLQLNGGIAGAIGNIFVLDDNTKLMKITDDVESLGNISQKLYQKLNNEMHDFLEYKFSVRINQFPRLLFECNELERSLARDFLNKLLFYSDQADENGIERILKNDIEDCQREHPNYFQAKTDAIFLEYHNKIQEWWMKTNQVEYLTRESDLFQKSIHSIIKEPLMNSININFMSKIKNNTYTFNDDAVSSLNLQDQHAKTIIVAENCVLTVMKMLQNLMKKKHFVLDVGYVIKLPMNERNALRIELANTNNILIFVCDKIRNAKNEKRILENIAAVVQEKKTIIVTRKLLLPMITECFPNAEHIVNDVKSSLIAMTEESQKIILENATMLFQGTEIKLNAIIDDKSKAFVKGDVLNKIINEERIVVGKLIINKTYDEIKHLYINRRVKKAGDQVGKIVTTLNNILDDIVLVTAEPGMGKTTLLTHLSINTKECNPEIWIVRINLLEYSREFSKWKEEKTNIDTLEALKFVCQVMLRDKGKNCDVEIELEDSTGGVYLKHCTGDQWTEFELNLFLHNYNKGMIIFLFDGFDEICPHYVKEVIKCINSVSNKQRKHRKWITSRSYNEVQTILQREFGSPYEIDYFSTEEMEKYLETFWGYHLRLEELNTEQLHNVKAFIEYMIDSENEKPHEFAMPLYQVYINAVYYLINEIRYKQIPLWTYTKKFDDSRFSEVKDEGIISSIHDDNSRGNPLHLYLTAIFFEDNIKSVNANTNKWSLEVNAITFYERFMEIKMKNIRFQEKNELNITKPDIMMTYDKELADFIKQHKRLAAYAIFGSQM
ncbi:hypothetical protein PYW08_012907 [Mythimna loreyi]|uniref:Uncharacterized protein n=1 Tax=Mythimna loreyi TaxID=667449 RepID=A0ACC2Q3D4_9NEOP|nr:hypothetical protein PYW08_012907 [Mythimna loreyi]